MKSKLTIGGQAVIEGVMMRSLNKYAICVRKPNKKISTKVVKLNTDHWYNKIPIIRGIFRFGETIYIGVKSITYSASEALGKEEKPNTLEIILTILFSIALTIILFYVIPLIVARFLTQNRGIYFNFLDGILRIIIFLLYLLGISLMSDIRRIFQYHGAEHMTVHCYEKGEKLTVKNIKKYTTLHPRCGTNFIIVVFVISIFIFSFISATNYLGRLGLRLLLLPFIAGVSYEFLRFAGKNINNPIIKVLVFPGLMLQKITTRNPDDNMIEVAIKALKAAV